MGLGTALALTSCPEPTAYHILILLFFSPVGWVFVGWLIHFLVLLVRCCGLSPRTQCHRTLLLTIQQ